MYNALYSYVSQKVDLSPHDFDLIREAFKPKTLRKRQYLLQAGDISKYLAFVVSGALRLFHVDEKGDEHIIQFAIENWWISDRESFSNSTPSLYHIDAVEDSQLLVMDFKQSEQLERLSPAYRKMVEQIKEVNAIAQQKRVISSLSFTAREKYKAFLTTYPDLAQRFPQRMIASYLGLKPETLSRLRKKLKP